MAESTAELQRVCVKVYAPEPGIGDQAYVPIFHDWIRDRAIEGLVLFDVADYAHVPEGPGIVLVTHEAHFAMDRSDGRFGLLAQRRVDSAGSTLDVLTATLRQTLQIADRLEREPRLGGKVAFDRSALRVESNDRLRGPNTDEGYRSLEPVVRAAVAAVRGAGAVSVTRVRNDPRDRLAVDVKVGAEVGAAS